MGFPRRGDNHCLYPDQLGESEKSSGFSVPSPSRVLVSLWRTMATDVQSQFLRADAFVDCSAVLNVIQSYRGEFSRS
jgi:hypothetical protein